MTKYEIVEIRDEWKCNSATEAESYRPGDTASGDGVRDYLESFETKAEALEALKAYKNSYILRPSWGGGWYFLVEEYLVEENEYDEDGEFDQGGDIWEVADSSEWDRVLNHDRLGKNKFRLEIAMWDGNQYSEWDILAPESEEWFDSVRDFLQALDMNNFFEDFKYSDDVETLEKEYFKVVASYACNDGDEDYPLSWAEVSEMLEA
jgi:hypothetical protein